VKAVAAGGAMIKKPPREGKVGRGASAQEIPLFEAQSADADYVIHFTW
jgi:hypothetical protein